ncbi:sulfatase [Fulvivirgaceae bacterium BMA10]|uniref:Sulfatase n=1 Tax=Splendidivirga corallicola TaxID=3051826 RepID=A0ABT8KU37_9BACT|nr:sulfatase [Fulvivirgaceae bacterium BMA10]
MAIFTKQKKKLNEFLLLIVLFIPFSTFSQSTEQKDVLKPNIIFILVDDFGWNQVGCYGNEIVRTPNLDKLAEEGAKFTSAYVMPQCSPTRAAFLSGKYPARSGMTKVINNRFFGNAPMLTPKVRKKLPSEWYSLAKMLKSAGYTTGISGKWHVADNYPAAPIKEKKGITYFNAYGFDWVGDASEGKAKKDKAVMDITNEVLGFIDQNKENPFFAFVSHFTTHSPLAAPDTLVEKYVKKGYTKMTDKWGLVSERPTADILAMTEHLDYSIGLIMEKLEKLGLAENTLLVAMGDNGALGRFWDHSPLRESKGSLYEGGIRVPLIMKWPKTIQAKTEIETSVHIIDMYPTFMEIAGADRQKDYKIDGESLIPLLNNNEGFTRDILYFHHPHYVPMYAKTPGSIVRKGDYKLIYYFGDYLDTEGHEAAHRKLYGKLKLGEKVELFNIKKDIGEKNDLSADMPEKVEEMMSLLRNWWDETGAPMPVANQDYNPDAPFAETINKER